MTFKKKNLIKKIKNFGQQNRDLNLIKKLSNFTLVESCFLAINQSWSGFSAPTTYQTYIDSMSPEQLNDLVQYVSYCGRILIAGCDRPMVIKMENLLNDPAMINTYQSIRVQPCSLTGTEALNMLLANPGTLEIPYFFDGGSYATCITILGYLLRFSSNDATRVYPLTFITLQILLNGWDAVCFLDESNWLGLNGLPDDSVQQVAGDIDRVVQLLQNEPYSRLANIDGEHFQLMNVGMDPYVTPNA